MSAASLAIMAVGVPVRKHKLCLSLAEVSIMMSLFCNFKAGGILYIHHALC